MVFAENAQTISLTTSTTLAPVLLLLPTIGYRVNAKFLFWGGIFLSTTLMEQHLSILLLIVLQLWSSMGRHAYVPQTQISSTVDAFPVHRMVLGMDRSAPA